MGKMNCWEYKKCGREPGGAKVAELGECPAAIQVKTDGLHGGVNGGRVCWAIGGTLCGGKVQGTFAAKSANCLACEFYREVQKQESGSLISPAEIISKLK